MLTTISGPPQDLAMHSAELSIHIFYIHKYHQFVVSLSLLNNG